MTNEIPERESFYPATHWTQIFQARNLHKTSGRNALGELLAGYRNALLQHLAWEFPVRPERAEDWLQSFVERELLEYQLMQHVDRDRGRFRTFLLNAFGLLMSLNMLIETPGGFDYTGDDWQGWMRAAGFRQTRVEHLVGPDSMVIGIK